MADSTFTDPTLRPNQRIPGTGTQPTSSPTGLRPGGFGSNSGYTPSAGDPSTTPAVPGSGAYNPDPAAQTGPPIKDPYADTRPVPTQSGPAGPTKSGDSYTNRNGVDASFDKYVTQYPAIGALKTAIQSGAQGQAAADQVNRLYPQAHVTWDATRGNFNMSTGGPNGLQIDTNAAGVYGVHEYDDAGMPGGGGSWGGGSSGGGIGDISSMFKDITDPRSNDLYNMLMGRASQSLQLSPKDPIIANQVNAFGANAQRGARDYIDQMAESEGPDANLGAERRLATEHATQSTGQMQAALMQNELTARRGEIQQALTEMGTLLTSQQQLALQQELGQINAMLASGQLGLDAQNWANRWDYLRSTGSTPGI